MVLKLLGILCNVIYTVDYNELLSKKRDLSDKSRDGEDSKKVKESDILSSLTDEVFSDGLNSPGLAKLLANCLKSIETQVKKLFTFHEEARNLKLKSLSHLNLCQQSLTIVKRKSRKKIKRLISWKKPLKI